MSKNTKKSNCKVCSLEETIKNEISGLGPVNTSRVLSDKYGVNISEASVRRHNRNHVKDYQPVENYPKGLKPRIDLDPSGEGEIVSKPVKEKSGLITDFSDIMREMGIDPDEFEVVGSAGMSRWQSGNGEWLTSYRIKVRKVVKSDSIDIDDLLSVVSDIKPTKSVHLNGDKTFVFAAGDCQLGKSDGDGIEGIITRYTASLQRAVDKATSHAGEYGPILICYVGDLIEGFVSQGGKNAWMTELTITQQVQLLRRLILETIKAFAPLTDDLQVISVPGNHDESNRALNMPGSDSWAVDALEAVSMALEMNPEAFGHVKCHIVAGDELTYTLSTSGTTITAAHGHQWRPGKHEQWWSEQSLGKQDPGEADILLCGHLHSGMVEQIGQRWMIRVPSYESESTWFRHLHGKVGNPSGVTFLTKNGSVESIDFE